MKKFMLVFSEDDKSKLLKLGFKLVSEHDGVAAFLNDNKILFNQSDISHISYSDILAI